MVVHYKSWLISLYPEDVYALLWLCLLFARSCPLIPCCNSYIIFILCEWLFLKSDRATLQVYKWYCHFLLQPLGSPLFYLCVSVLALALYLCSQEKCAFVGWKRQSTTRKLIPNIGYCFEACTSVILFAVLRLTLLLILRIWPHLNLANPIPAVAFISQSVFARCMDS